MFYDAQIAGLPDNSVTALRAVKHLSVQELLERREEVIVAVRKLADLELINGGGTGSLHVASRDHQADGARGRLGLVRLPTSSITTVTSPRHQLGTSSVP